MKFMFTRRNLTLFIILLILIVLPVAVFMAQKQQDTRQRASGEEATVFFAELGNANPPPLSQITLTPGSQKILALFVDTGTTSINGFDVTVNLGNALSSITINDAAQGTDAERFESEIFKELDRTTGIIRFAKTTSDSSKTISGKLHIGTVAFTVRTNAAGTGSIGTTRAELVSVAKSTPLTVAQANLSYTIGTSTPPVCAQVITYARNPQSGQCQMFPTPCDVPAGWETCTPDQLSTTPSGAARLSFNLILQGIGADPGGNRNPSNAQRNIHIQLIGNNINREITDSLAFNSSSGSFTGAVEVRDIPSGNYNIKIKVDKYLRKQISGIQNITPGTTIQVPSATLVAGDVSGDNKIDILDYNIIRGCLGNTSTPITCPNPALADINDDGKADPVDLNLMLRSLSSQRGD